MYGVPSKVRKRRQKFIKRQVSNSENVDGVTHASNYSCCWAGDKVQKSRYAEDEVPPPPSPPHGIVTNITHDGVSRQSSLERRSGSGRGNRRSSTAERDQLAKEIHVVVSALRFPPLFF
ncbi:hypothetical protein JTB14_002927 [Gonioctena quinquepunctata]|nr:hypothetical protein JTB14_002927 [Gonioctena quinquepunctata]